MLPFYLFLLLLGLVIGSFVGMLTYRLPRGLSLRGRSFCDKCKKPIPWYENIPVFYYLWSRGTCGACGSKIHWRYPVIEVLTAVAFVSTGYLWLQPGAENVNLGVLSLLFFILLTTCYISLIVTDLEFQILPDEILLGLALLLLLYLLLSPSPTLFVNILSGFSVFVFFLLLHILTRGRGMGFGDVKMVFVLGSLLGFPGVLVWLFLSFLTGALVGIILLLLGRAKLGRPVPFGPFLLASAWVTIFWGSEISQWYTNLL